MNRRNSGWVLAIAGLCGMASAHAYEAGDFVVRAGAALAQPEDSSGAIAINGIGKVAGTGAGVGDDTQLGLTASYIVAPHWGIELLAATPFEHEITGKGLGGFGVHKIGSTKHLPPTLSVQYYFAEAESAWQPYVGLGINYTVFFSEKLSSEAKAGLGASHLELDDSVGLAMQAGLDWRIDRNWLINVAVWKVDIDTTATLNTALGKAKVDVDIDPWVYMLAVGYRF